MLENGLEIPSVPHLVHIETTYACNQSCRFCYNPMRDIAVDQEKIARIVDSVYNSHIPHVYLIGGEPSILGTEVLNKYIEKLSQRSSVTIVTNGQIYLEGLSEKLACLGIPMHGLEETHDYLARKKGSFKRAVESIKAYVVRGFDVRCIPVLTRQNFDQMYETIRLAKGLGMESVFVDRYEDGGLGSCSSDDLKPSLEQFRIALGQMIKARDDFNIPVGWGTAIPFCLDERLVSENMTADCGVGITFAAVNPDGNVRLCNQSERIYGNVLAEPIEQIWRKDELDEFRNLSWVGKPCIECQALTSCVCGCKVDANCSDTSFCVDYAVREKEGYGFSREPQLSEPDIIVPTGLRNFRVNRYARLNLRYEEQYLVTRYQTVCLDDKSVDLFSAILSGIGSEADLIRSFRHMAEDEEIRLFVSKLEIIQAIDILES